MKNRKNRPKIEGVGRSYLVTMSLLFAAFLLYVVFALPPEQLSANFVLWFIPVFVLVLLFFPLLVLGLGLYLFIAFWSSADFLLCFVPLLGVFALYFMWWGIWRLIFGRPQKLTVQIS